MVASAPRILLLPALLAACAGSYQGTKDGLTPYPAVPREELDAAHAPRKLALLIGVDRFDDPSWRRLRYAVRDARELGATLLDPAVGGFDRVVVRSSPEETTAAALRAALDELAASIGDPRDTTVVYLSTHGTLARGGDGVLRSYVVARDTRMADVPGSALPSEELRSRFAALRSNRKVLVLATCHSGQGKSGLPEPVRRELAGLKSGGFFVPPLAAMSEASVILSASAWGETAREDEKLSHDIYTFFLLEALRKGLDDNGDGAVTVSEAHQHALHGTYRFTAGRQRPSAVSDILGEDPIVLAGEKVRPGRPALVGYDVAWEDVRVRVDGAEKGALPGEIVLDPGVHAIELYRGVAADPFVATSVDLAAGQRLDVRTLLPAPPLGLELSLSAGGRGFLAEGARAELLSPGPMVRLEAALLDVPWPGWLLAGDVGYGRYVAALEPGGVAVSASQEELVVGIGLYRELSWRRARLRGGPRIDALSLRRSLEGPSGFVDDDGVFTLGVGGAAGLGVPLAAGFEARLDARLSLVYVRVDDVARNLTNAALFAGLGYRL